MRLLILRYKYGFYRACAYLASHMDDYHAVSEYQSVANEYHRQWLREQIQ